MTLSGTFKSERENVDEDIAVIGSGPLKVEVDLMSRWTLRRSPRSGPDPESYRPVDRQFKEAVDPLIAQGVRFTPGGIRKAPPVTSLFIHPKGNAEAPLSGEGVLIEMIQAPPEVIAAFTR